MDTIIVRTDLKAAPDGSVNLPMTREEFLEQAARELLDEEWKKRTTSKLPKTTDLQAASRRIG